VELLVVLSILAVLGAIFLPSFGRARAVSRATICRNNLRRICDGLAVRVAKLSLISGGQPTHYPMAEEWPFVPFSDFLPVPQVFVCPETDDEIVIESGVLSNLVYINRDSSDWKPARNIEIRFDDPHHQGLGHKHLGTRRGSDERGDYIEVGLDDNSIVTERYMDNDGHDGIIRIYFNDRRTGRAIAKLMAYSCREYNTVLAGGKPLFVNYPDEPPDGADPDMVTDPNHEAYGWLGPGRSKVGMEVQLGAMSCSYGMTRGSEKFRAGSGRILVLDYDETIVDPGASNVQDMLQQGARHLGRLNVLYTDGSVRRRGPTEIDPLIPGNARLWRP
jgi:prepilin-type processing-associated H-X9-DG protein